MFYIGSYIIHGIFFYFTSLYNILKLSLREKIAGMRRRTAMAEPLLNLCERRKHHSIDYTPQYFSNQSKQWSQSSVESTKPKKVMDGGWMVMHNK